METLFRLFMYLLPYGLSIAAFVWIGKKAWRVPNKIAKVIALLIVAAGLGYTLYKMISSIGEALSNDNFEFMILIINVFVLFFASLAITLGEPEEEPPSNENKARLN
jgi:amino acid transporter